MGHCVAGGAVCLRVVPTYLPGTVLQGCRLLKLCRNLPPGHCFAGVQAFKVVWEPSFQALWGRGAGCLWGVGTHLPCTVLQGCRLFKQCWNLPPGHCVAGCRLFKRCLNLPAGHCVAMVQAFKVVSEHSSQALWAGVQAVYGVSEPTSHALCCRCAGCLSGVGTFLLGTVLQGCRLLKWYGNLPSRH